MVPATNGAVAVDVVAVGATDDPEVILYTVLEEGFLHTGCDRPGLSTIQRESVWQLIQPVTCQT